ncbi:MAG: serine hydrolase [Hyphomicrobium sp.]|nr:serine hydrolase [Hyphomicrobium sp.]
MVIDANTGKVLHNQSGDALRHPASLTKMMTLYLAFEAIEGGRTSFNTRIPVSQRAEDQAPSKIGAKAGTEIALGDAIRALIVKSANDMAVAVAEHLAGNESDFAKLMTRRARALGMNNTVFRNASGLPDPEQVTTARDMLTLAMRLADDFPEHYKLFSTKTFSYGRKTFRTHNALLKRFSGIDGIKTGYTRASGFNLVSSYRSDGKHVVAAVFGGVSAGARDAYMRLLIFQALEKASTERTRPTERQLLAMAQPAKRPAKSSAAGVPTPVRKPEIPAREEPVNAEQVRAAENAPARASPAPAPQSPPLAPLPPSVVVAEAPPMAAEQSPANTVTPAFSVAKVRTISVVPPSATTAFVSERRSVSPPPATADAKSTIFAEANGTTPAPAGKSHDADASAPRFNFAALRQTLAEGSADTHAETERPTYAPNSDATDATPSNRISLPPPRPLFARAEMLDTPRKTATDAAPEAAPEANLPARALETVVAKHVVEPPPVVGRAPSTFGEQLAKLETPPSHLGMQIASTEPQRDARPAGRHQIQIGAYRTEGEAQVAFKTALERAPDALSGSEPIVVPVPAGNTMLYRARFTGFEPSRAMTACNELRRRSVDCFVAARD